MYKKIMWLEIDDKTLIGLILIKREISSCSAEQISI